MIVKCPECSTPLNERLRQCGGVRLQFCTKCGYQAESLTGAIDFGQVHDYALKDAQFRRIVRKAMIVTGIRDLDHQTSFMQWMIGEDFAHLPYMIRTHARFADNDDWLSRIKSRVKLLNIDGNAPVYAVICAAAQIFLNTRTLIRTA